MDTPLEYTEGPDGRIHLARDFPVFGGDTLCGIPITEEFLIGDETLSGFACTCIGCLGKIVEVLE